MRIGVFLTPLLVLALCQTVCLVEALVLPNFYPFGASEGDKVVPRNDDGSSGRVPISTPFPFFDHYHNSLFVSISTQLLYRLMKKRQNSLFRRFIPVFVLFCWFFFFITIRYSNYLKQQDLDCGRSYHDYISFNVSVVVACRS